MERIIRTYSALFEDHKEPLNYDDRRIQVSEEGLRGFYLIIAHAVYRKQVKANLVLPSQADELTSAVWDMNRREKFEHKNGVAYIPWLHLIFNGKSPKLLKLFKSRNIRGRQIVEVSTQFDLEVRFHECVPDCNERKLNNEEIEAMYYKYLPDECKTLKVSLNIKRGGEQIVINNFGRSGVLRFLDYVNVEIDANFATKFLVFWVNTEKSIRGTSKN